MATQAEHRVDRAEMYDAEVIEHGQELEVHHGAEIAPSNLFGVSDPVDVIERAEKVASALKSVIDAQGLVQNIKGNEHVKVDGWTLLGSMLGVFPVPVWTRKIEDGWEARVEARTRLGEIVGAGDAMCTRSEPLWKNRSEQALRSMAQTRATSKALKLPLGFVVTLAGYNSTPAEEMPSSGGGEPPPDSITDAQHRKIGVLLKELDQVAPMAEGQQSWVDQLRAEFGVKSRKDMTKTEAGQAIDWLEKRKADADIPFG